MSVLGSAVQMAAFGYCLYLLWSGKILYGTMTLFLSQGTKLSSAFNALVRTVPSFLSASVSARRIRDLFALEPEPVLPDDGLDRQASRGFTVAAEGVSYGYVPRQPVLTRADFRAAPARSWPWWVPPAAAKPPRSACCWAWSGPRRAGHICRPPTGGRWR